MTRTAYTEMKSNFIGKGNYRYNQQSPIKVSQSKFDPKAPATRDSKPLRFEMDNWLYRNWQAITMQHRLSLGERVQKAIIASI